MESHRRLFRAVTAFLLALLLYGGSAFVFAREGGADDPVRPGPAGNLDLSYSSFLGGGYDDLGGGVAFDRAGNIYISGFTDSRNFPVHNALQPVYGGGRYDVFIAKLDPSAGTLIYSTYLGGSGDDEAWAIAVDPMGSVYVAGYTDSTNFPLANPLQPANAGGRDAFVARLSPDGAQLVYSTYLGGSGTDEGYGVAVDALGNAVVAGETRSPNFPVHNAYQPNLRGTSDAFAFSLTPSGSSLAYSTYLGGSDAETSLGVAVDGPGNAYLTGGTFSSDFPVMNAFQPVYRGIQDAFVTRIAPTGAVGYSTYLGGSGYDLGWAITASQDGAAYLTGFTGSPDFPTAHPIQPVKSAELDAYVIALEPSGLTLRYGTFLGGNGVYDGGYGIALDSAGNAFVSGLTGSTDFPVVEPVQSSNRGGDEAFLTAVNAGGTAFIYSTYLGGDGTDYGYGVAVDPFGNALMVGQTHSDDFPAVDPFQPQLVGSSDAFISRITRPCGIAFSDVPEGSTFYPYVRCLACRGVVGGYPDGTFRPGEGVSRGQLAKIVSNTAGFAEQASGQAFEDVPPGSTFYTYTQRLSARGIMQGYACGGAGEPCVPPLNRPYFRPGASSSRGQMAKLMCLAGQYLDPPSGQAFEDVPPGSTFYTYTQQIATRGIMQGYACGGAGEPCVPPLNRPYFRTAPNASRGQVSKVTMNTFCPACDPGEQHGPER